MGAILMQVLVRGCRDLETHQRGRSGVWFGCCELRSKRHGWTLSRGLCPQTTPPHSEMYMYRRYAAQQEVAYAKTALY